MSSVGWCRVLVGTPGVARMIRKAARRLTVGMLIGLPLVWLVNSGADAQPDLTVTADGQHIAVIRGSSCWPQMLQRALCVDSAPTPELLKGEVPEIVPPGAHVRMTFGRSPASLAAWRWVSGAPIQQEVAHGHTIILPLAPGVYLYSVSARWDEGDASYAFVVAVR